MIAQPYAVKHTNPEIAESLGRGLVVGDHFSIGQDENNAPIQVYGLLVIWENQRSPAQSFHEPQELENQLDFDDYFEIGVSEDEDEEEVTTSSDSQSQIPSEN